MIKAAEHIKLVFLSTYRVSIGVSIRSHGVMSRTSGFFDGERVFD